MDPEMIAEKTAFALAENRTTRHMDEADRRELLADILRPSIGHQEAEELASVYAESWGVWANICDNEDAITDAEAMADPGPVAPERR